MNNSDIASLRLYNQRLINSNAEEPGAVGLDLLMSELDRLETR